MFLLTLFRLALIHLAALLLGELVSLGPEALAHLAAHLPGVHKLDQAALLVGLGIGEDPHVGGDASVVEHLVGQGDDALEEVGLDDPAADLGFPGLGGAGEQR